MLGLWTVEEEGKQVDIILSYDNEGGFPGSEKDRFWSNIR